MTNKNQSVFIIAEVGSVHDGSFGNAKKLIEAAAACGVDAVKFQTHIPGAETLPDAPMPPYFKGEPRFEYFQRTGFSLDQWVELKRHCDEHGVVFLSSPFSEEAVELLESVGVPRYKIPSGEVTNLPMLEKIARLGKPVILSSGMSSWDELDQAVEVIQKYNAPLTVLQCTSEYPVSYERVGLNIMQEMAGRYGAPVGLSDHTLTNYAALAAVTLGASIIEKHFTFSRLMYGSDAPHSLEPAEMTDLVRGVRAIETILAHPLEKRSESFREMKRIFEKSLVAAVDIPAGTLLTSDLIAIKKPGAGISPARLDEFIGKTLKRDVKPGHVFSECDFE
ncbi:MAG: N-acetylneuraminate synthase [Chloroflexi bacterium]|nr:N-acetylneuraminate synthase [Chloroflexota bacterium]